MREDIYELCGAVGRCRPVTQNGSYEFLDVIGFVELPYRFSQGGLDAGQRDAFDAVKGRNVI
jgi:hypothetical protein